MMIIDTMALFKDRENLFAAPITISLLLAFPWIRFHFLVNDKKLYQGVRLVTKNGKKFQT